MRRIIPINDDFFHDGHGYVFSSTSIEKSSFPPQRIEEILFSDDHDKIKELIDSQLCFPVMFPGDCALDDAIFIVGDLDPEEESEWIAKLSGRLNIPCGTFLFMGGSLEESFEEAIHTSEPEDDCFFKKISLIPGDYIVEIYAFLGSLTVNENWDEFLGCQSLEAWSTKTHGKVLDWVKSFLEDDYLDGESLGLQEYIIRLEPYRKQDISAQKDYRYWASKFEFRTPEQCPKGLSFSKYR